MAIDEHSNHESGLVVHADKPLIGIVFIEDGHEVTHYFADESEARAAVAARRVSRTDDFAGIWRDLDWEEAVEALDRIRHESTPTPPIDEL